MDKIDRMEKKMMNDECRMMNIKIPGSVIHHSSFIVHHSSLPYILCILSIPVPFFVAPIWHPDAV